MNRKINFINLTGELVLELLKKVSNLPSDTELISLEPRTIRGENLPNEIRLFIQSKEFGEIIEGQGIKLFDLYVRHTTESEKIIEIIEKAAKTGRLRIPKHALSP